MILKVRKVNSQHPRTKQKGFAARAVTNGKADFASVCELAGLNTTMNVAELEAAGKLILQAAARELKNGKIVDLGPLGSVYPAVTGKWAADPDDLVKADLKPKVNYRPSDDINAAIAAAKLAWASAEDEKKEQENGGENTVTDDDETGDQTGDDNQGGTDNGGSQDNTDQGGDDNGGSGGDNGNGDLEG